MSAMTLYIKHKDAYVKHYWIRRENSCIVGWFAGDAYRIALGLPEHANLDIHFTYPRSGELHYSLKCRDALTGIEHYHTVFHNRVKRKTVRPGWKTEISESARGAGEDLFTHLMGHFRPPSFDDFRSNADLWFQFPNCGIPVSDGFVAHGPRELAGAAKERPSSSSDLVIDPGRIAGKGMNISAFLYGGATRTARENSWVVADSQDIPKIELSARF